MQERRANTCRIFGHLVMSSDPPCWFIPHGKIDDPAANTSRVSGPSLPIHEQASGVG
jgi:hypothetical protein